MFCPTSVDGVLRICPGRDQTRTGPRVAGNHAAGVCKIKHRSNSAGVSTDQPRPVSVKGQFAVWGGTLNKHDKATTTWNRAIIGPNVFVANVRAVGCAGICQRIRVSFFDPYTFSSRNINSLRRSHAFELIRRLLARRCRHSPVRGSS